MREIKFRCINLSSKIMSYSKDWSLRNQPYETFDEFFNAANEREDIFYMQFTGLHDLEGNEIYEGDKLYYDGEPCPHCQKKLYPSTAGNYEVKWDHQNAQWTATNDDDNWMDPSVWKELKIVGNIYEGKVAAADQTD